eukprot:364968-Chlamydomonas_euryale.AAC.12
MLSPDRVGPSSTPAKWVQPCTLAKWVHPQPRPSGSSPEPRPAPQLARRPITALTTTHQSHAAAGC